VTFDGDADRIIYFFGVKDVAPVLIDGDKQACLIFTHI